MQETHLPKRTMSKRAGVLVMLLLLLSLLVVPVMAEGPNRAWVTYTDPRFGFLLDYPVEWQIIPRDDDPEALGAVLTFMPPYDARDTSLETEMCGAHDTSRCKVSLGLYLAETKDGESLTEWTERYEESSSDDDGTVTRQPMERLKINRVDAIQQKGVSLRTEFVFTNIPHGNTVWFMWANFDDSSPYFKVYEEMVNSFKFGANTPTNLKEVYGDLSHSVGSYGSLEAYPQIFALPASWQSPVHNQYNVNCGSPWHVGSAAWAADVATPNGTSLYNSHYGNLLFAGWNNAGYGNLIKILSSYDTAYYAHLSYISIHICPTSLCDYGGAPGPYVYTGKYLGKSGDTGNGPSHLHFHVAWQDLTGMTGFNPNWRYPGTWGMCGTMGP